MNRPISIRDYSPKSRVPLDMREILMRQVQKEDWANHQNDEVPKLPSYQKSKAKWHKVAIHAFSREVYSFFRP